MSAEQALLEEGTPLSPLPNTTASDTTFSSRVGSTAFRMTLFVLTTALVTLNGIAFPLALSGNTDMTSFTIYTQVLYSVVFAFLDVALEIIASFAFPTSPLRELQNAQAAKSAFALTERVIGRQQRRRWLVRGAAEWYDHRHMVSLGLLMACNALMSAYGGSADRTPLTIQAAMNMLTNILGVRLKITVFGLSNELPWFSLSKFNRYYYGSALSFTLACVLVVMDRTFVAKVPDGQFGPLAILYALGNIALVIYVVELDKMLYDADAEKNAMKKIREDQERYAPTAGSLPASGNPQSPLIPALPALTYNAVGSTFGATRSDDLQNSPPLPPVLSFGDEKRIRAQHFDDRDEPRSSIFKIYAHVHRTVAILRRVQLSGLAFVLLLSLFALIPGLDQAGTLSLPRLEATICPMLGMDNLYINLFNFAVIFGFITSTILNEIDASLVMTSANASQIMQLAVGWIPTIGPLAVGYFPNITITLTAIALSVLGVWCAQRYSVELCRIAAEAEKKKIAEAQGAPQ